MQRVMRDPPRPRASGGETVPPTGSTAASVGTHDGDVVVLCNAEPFGFGPAASLACVLPHLHELLDGSPRVSLQYVGSGHTLALNKPRGPTRPHGFDKVHDIDVYKEGGPEGLARLCKTLRPTLFVTVSDATAASAALGAGVPVVVIDLLLWFWPQIPAPWQGAQRVLAADFEGVRARVQGEALRNVTVVPPIAPPLSPVDAPRAGVLLNLGGLRNPYIPASEHVSYAKAIHRAMDRALALCGIAKQRPQPLHVVASPEIVQALGPQQARTVDPVMCQGLMRATQLKCITPGLNNLFDASAAGGWVLTLPPANDSQGRQMRLLARQGLLDDAVDWHELVDVGPIDYEKPQPQVLQDIQTAQQKLLDDKRAQGRLTWRMVAAVLRSAGPAAAAPALRGLVDRYGSGGARVMAEAVVGTLVDLREGSG
jgi:hypothetical protein